MIKTINIDDLYIGVPEHIYNKEAIETDFYLIKMKDNLKSLPPIEVIDLWDGTYSLSNGYHRVSIYKYLGIKKIKAEIY